MQGRALQIVKEYMGFQMSEEEQGFITLHIVNATMPQRSDRLIISVQLVRDVLAIVSERYSTTLDDTSLPYERFRSSPAVFRAASARSCGRANQWRRAVPNR